MVGMGIIMAGKQHRICSLEGCARAHVARGYCKFHWQRWSRHGDPLRESIPFSVGWSPPPIDDPTFAILFWSNVCVTANPEKCWEWQGGRDANGYGHVMVSGTAWLAHRLAFRLHYGQVPAMLACHHCDNPPCVNPHHLYDGTHADNARDAVVRHRRVYARGEAVTTSKYTEAQIVEVKRLLAQIPNKKAVARLTGIHPNTVYAIAKGTQWGHVR